MAQIFVDRYVVPGLAGGILSAILAAIDQGDDPPYIANRLFGRSATDQAGYQMAGVGLSLGTGIFAGAVIGIIFKFISVRGKYGLVQDYHLYNDDLPSREESESGK